VFAWYPTRKKTSAWPFCPYAQGGFSVFVFSFGSWAFKTLERRIPMSRFTLRHMVRSAVIAALYAAITMALAPISYGQIQFRVSEAMTLLAFIDPWYIPGLFLGCVLANLSSPLGWIDVVVGSGATLVALGGIALVRRALGPSVKALMLASLMPVVANGLLVGWELNYLFQIPYLMAAAYVAAGELVVVTAFGTVLFRQILRNEALVKLLKF